ncbi:MAG: matrixin family metalloprotease [Gemmatimonadaceae bacterium]|nr:matrixin family metalloprotease [Gemmatimonadaceae bacterium]
MNRTVAVLSLLLLGMAAFIVVQARRVPPRPTPMAAAIDSGAATPVAVENMLPAGEGGAGLVSVRESSSPAPRRDLAEIQRRLADGESGTYIREILLQRSDNNARWTDRQLEPLRVWIQPHSDLPDFDASYPVRAREAFERWTRTGVPVAFTFVVDSARSDIPLVWVDKFDMPISGRARWTRDQHWWIVGSSVEVALHHQSGTPLEPDAIYAITLHEVGHVLGLDHTMDDRSIMAARVRVRELSLSDEHTLQLVYSIPPGSVSVP